MTRDEMAAHVLGICQRVKCEFTLREIVARVMAERPEMVLDFAEVWGALIRDQKIRVCRHGQPNLYSVVERESDRRG